MVVIKPNLKVNEIPASVKVSFFLRYFYSFCIWYLTTEVLEETSLVIDSTDQYGVSTTKEIKSFALYDDKYAIITLRKLIIIAGNRHLNFLCRKT